MDERAAQASLGVYEEIKIILPVQSKGGINTNLEEVKSSGVCVYALSLPVLPFLRL